MGGVEGCAQPFHDLVLTKSFYGVGVVKWFTVACCVAWLALAGGTASAQKFDGLAQLGNVTYALIEQPDKGASHFLKVGDRVDDAQVLRVSPKELVLAEAGSGEVRVPRVDAMAELMHSSRGRPAAAAAPPAASSAPTTSGAQPATGAPTASTPPPVLPSAGGGNDVRALSDPFAATDRFGGGRRNRRRDQMQVTPGGE